ncbi:MAG: hypothetical protein AMXMBFR84_08280 [Candidatus Hydrogenedentota bacterium]
MNRYTGVAVQVVYIALLFSPFAANGTEIERKPLSKPDWLGPIEPAPYKTFVGIDPQTGKEIHEDLKPSIEFDAERVEYHLKWFVPWENRNSSTIWVPSVNLDVVASANVELRAEGYRFTFKFLNSEKSIQHASGVIIFCPAGVSNANGPDDSWKRLPSPSTSKRIYNFWFDTSPPIGIPPGDTGEFTLVSAGWPAIVDCHVHGHAPTLRTDSEMPGAIENALPRGLLEDCLNGKTIGPAPIPPPNVESVGAILAEMKECPDTALKWGWATDDAAAQLRLRVETLSKAAHESGPREALAALTELSKIIDDFKAKEIITNEVVSVYEARIDWLKAYYEKQGTL